MLRERQILFYYTFNLNFKTDSESIEKF